MSVDQAIREMLGAANAWVRAIRGRLEEAQLALATAKSRAADAFQDAKDAVAPALGQGPLGDLEAGAAAVEDAVGDAEEALQAAENECYDDFDFEAAEADAERD
jgi:hypothetical protein